MELMNEYISHSDKCSVDECLWHFGKYSLGSYDECKAS